MMGNSITKLNIENFRHLKNLNDIKIGEKITIIAGENGTGKSCLLGLIGHVFSFRDKKKIIKSIDNKPLESQFSEVFRFSPIYDKGGEHKYSVSLHDGTTRFAESRYIDAEKRFRIDVGDRKKTGEGKIQKPVYYLGLKRLYPLAQEIEEKIEFDIEKKLNASDMELFSKWHNKVLVLDHRITPKHTKSRNKELYSPTSEQYDAFGNSAGQDNLAQIIMSILSFKRLKEDIGNNYPGGVLLIDELDATLYPAAQLKLLDVFLKACRDYDLQIIFTTHSIDIINYAFDKNKKHFEDNTEMIFLYRRGKNTSVMQEIKDIRPLIDELTHSATVSEKKTNNKINVYFEDEEARIFFKNIVDTSLGKIFNIQKVNLGNDFYKSLIESKFPEFNKSIVILDGDARGSFRRVSNPKVTFLPGKVRPENVIYDFLNSLDEVNDFWSQTVGGYSKSVFLSNKPDNIDNREIMKRWFNTEKVNWGNNCRSLFNCWKLNNALLVKKFNDDLKNVINKIQPEK